MLFQCSVWAHFQISPSGLSLFVRTKLQILTGAQIRTRPPVHGARQAEKYVILMSRAVRAVSDASTIKQALVFQAGS